MSMTPKLLLAIIVSTVLLCGCSTTESNSTWEYKTLSVYNTPDAELNKIVASGWTVVSMSQVENRYTFLLKRKK